MVRSGFGRRKYVELDKAVARLQPDQAILVLQQDAPGAHDERRASITQFRQWLNAHLQRHFPGARLSLIEDVLRGGVWLYKTPAGTPGSGRAIGLDKEAEIRSRTLD